MLGKIQQGILIIKMEIPKMFRFKYKKYSELFHVRFCLFQNKKKCLVFILIKCKRVQNSVHPSWTSHALEFFSFFHLTIAWYASQLKQIRIRFWGFSLFLAVINNIRLLWTMGRVSPFSTPVKHQYCLCHQSQSLRHEIHFYRLYSSFQYLLSI